MNRLIAIVGLPGSGKSEVVKLFVDNGFERVYFGQLTMDKLNEESLEVNEKNEKYMREKLRTDHGMAAYAKMNIPKIETHHQSKHVAIDGLYSWEEYLILKEKFPHLEVLAVVSSPKTRYERLANRPIRPLTAVDAVSRDHSQIANLNQGGPIAMADHIIHNQDSLENLTEKVLTFINEQN